MSSSSTRLTLRGRTGNIAEALLAADAAQPALLQAAQTLTHGQLQAAALACAADLLARGAAPQDRVGLIAENGPFFVAAYLGTIAAGLTVVPLPPDISRDSLEQIARSTGMRWLYASPRFAPAFASTGELLNLPILDRLPEPSAGSPAWDALRPVSSADDLAAIMFTSGSTGQPKGVMISHQNLWANTRDIVEYLSLSAADRAMLVLPLFYCFGLSVLHTHLAIGGSVALNNQFLFPEKVLDDLVAKECTGLAGVPSTYQILLRRTRFAQRQFPRLRWLQQAGGKLPDVFLRELRATLPHVRLFVMYGQTEATSRLSYLPPERLDDKLGSIGRGLAGTKLEVLAADGAPVIPGSGQLGEIVAQGENIARGYWNDPEETARFFRDRKLYTGDLAHVDADGFIFIADRSRDFIKSMGNRVSPKEVEAVIAELPQVVEAAVIGVPNEIWGEAIAAFVVPCRRDAIAEEEIRRHCLSRLPNHKLPQRIELIDHLPRTATGKIDKPRLKQQAQTAAPRNS